MQKSHWLVSAPALTARDKNAELIEKKLGKTAAVSSFDVPDLKVGTLDALMALSDDLGKYDNFVEAVTRKIANQLYSLHDNADHDKLLTVNQATPEHYLSRFRWDEAKYPVRAPCREIIDTVNSQVSKLDEELRNKSTDYSTVVHTLVQSDRGQTGNLLTKDLSEIVKREHWEETEYLTTIFVAVPKYNVKDWDNCYESLCEHVLPRSSKVIAQDSEFALCSVCLFKRKIDDFKTSAREKRFTVRDFTFDQQKIEAGKQEKQKLTEERELKKNKLILWCKTNFTEAFIGWIHLKAIRVFVESILRFGLPANFQAVLVTPFKKDDKRVRTDLSDLFKHLSSRHIDSHAGEDEGMTETFYPYVSLTINTEMKMAV